MADAIPESLEALLQASKKIPFLDSDQEITLGRQVRAWQDHPAGPDGAPEAVQRAGRRAIERFIGANIRLAYRIARKFRHCDVPLEDLTQAALDGLRCGFLRFDPQLGYRASSLCVWYARRSCQQLVAQQGSALRLPVPLSEKLRRAAIAAERLQSRGLEPSDELIEADLGLRDGEMHELRAMARLCSHLSLDASWSHADDGATLASYHGTGNTPLEQLERDDMRRHLTELITLRADLLPQQRYILLCRYLSDPPVMVNKLASDLNVHRNRITQLEASAMEILRQQLASDSAPPPSGPLSAPNGRRSKTSAPSS